MPRPSPITYEQELEVVRLYQEEGLGRNELARLFDADRNVISRRLIKHGVRIIPSPERCRAKLNHAAFADAGATEEAAYWVGFLMADGSVMRHVYNSTIYVSLNLCARDRDHVVRFLKFLGADSTIRQTRGGRPGRPTICYRADVASRELAADLAKYGVIPRKVKVATVYGLENNRHFWRGLVDGDGALTISERAGGRKARPVLQLCGALPLMTQFADYAEERAGSQARPHVCNLSYVTGLWCGPAVRMVRELYDGCTIALPRKLALAREILTRFG